MIRIVERELTETLWKDGKKMGKHSRDDQQTTWRSEPDIRDMAYDIELAEASSAVITGELQSREFSTPIIFTPDPVQIYDLLPESVRDRVTPDDFAVIMWTVHEIALEKYLRRPVEREEHSYKLRLEVLRKKHG